MKGCPQFCITDLKEKRHNFLFYNFCWKIQNRINDRSFVVAMENPETRLMWCNHNSYVAKHFMWPSADRPNQMMICRHIQTLHCNEHQQSCWTGPKNLPMHSNVLCDNFWGILTVFQNACLCPCACVCCARVDVWLVIPVWMGGCDFSLGSALLPRKRSCRICSPPRTPSRWYQNGRAGRSAAAALCSSPVWLRWSQWSASRWWWRGRRCRPMSQVCRRSSAHTNCFAFVML